MTETLTRRSGYAEATGRPAVMATRGMVATSHYLASAAGLAMLQRGGSAVDACIAANATLCVTYGHMAGLGGDCFAQVWDPNARQVQALNGSGRVGEHVTIDAYRSRGHDAIPVRGPLAAITVPGAVDAWAELHARFGKLEWSELFEPAIRYSAEGFPISRKFRDFIAQYADTLRQFEATARVFLRRDSAPREGDLLVLHAAAREQHVAREREARDFGRLRTLRRGDQ